MKALLTFLFIIVCCTLQNADATVRTFQFGGILHSSTIGGVSVGDPFVATLSYDDAQLPSSATPTQAFYSDFIFTVTVNGVTYSKQPDQFLIIKNDNQDGIVVYFNSFPHLYLTLMDYSGSALSSTGLPASINLPDFPDYHYLSWESSPTNNFTGHISSICTPDPVVTSNADNGPGSLREAIANACPGSTITFDPSLTGSTITLDSTIYVNDKNLVINGLDADKLSISGNNAVQIFNLRYTSDFRISGLTFLNAKDTGVFGGGAVSQFNSYVYINNCSFINNTTIRGKGGAIFTYDGWLDIKNSTFTGNTALDPVEGEGGAVHTESSIFFNCTFNANSASVSAGAVNLQSQSSMTNCTVYGNSVVGINSHYGGINAHYKDRLTNCIVAGNTSAGIIPDVGGYLILCKNNVIGIGSGGIVDGIDGNQVGTLANPINPLLTPLAYYGSTTQTMALLPGSPALNTGLDNTVPDYDQRGILRPQQTGTDVGAYESHGILLTAAGGDNQSAVVNTAFTQPLSVAASSSNNEPVDGGQIKFNPPSSGASCTLNSNTVTISGGVASSGTVTANAIVGGPYAVAAECTGATAVSFSLTNLPSCIIDPVVTTNADAGAGSLRQAMLDACPGSTITFDPSVSGTILLASTLPNVSNITIKGPGANILAISGNELVQIFNISAPGPFSISDLAIENGNGYTGGIYIDDAVQSLDVSKCSFTNNIGTLGGAICAFFGNVGKWLTVNESTFSNNQTSFVGGAAILSGSKCVITNSTFTGNISGNEAGAIYANNTSSIINCTISGNSAITNGGGVKCNSSMTISNSIIAGNTADGSGQDIFGSFSGSNNIIGTVPLLAPLANYGGTTQTMALLPGSPAINSGTNTGAPLTDQRGKSRNGTTDIGAFESQGFSLTIAGGNNQNTIVNTNFTNPLSVTVTSSNSEPVNGGKIIFTPPSTGASCILGNDTAEISSGSATSGIVTANGVVGSYFVDANSIGASATVNFNLTNKQACTLTCPADITVNNKYGFCGAYVNYPAVVKNGPCGTAALSFSQASGSWFPVGTTTVSVTSTTGAVCSFNVIVKDAYKPVITCAGNITVTASGNSCSKLVTFNNTAIDNCSGVTVISVPPSGTLFPVGKTTVTITATDASGNSSTKTFTVTVKETVSPVITCPGNITVNTSAGQCSAIVNTGTATATDNCSTAIITASRSDSKSLTSSYPKGVTTITWKATDASGNCSTCQQKITVKDIIPPVISNISASKTVLWPADHSLKTITINYSSNDNCSNDCSSGCVLSVTSNEPVSGTGAGDLSPDWQIINNHSIKLRSERKSTGSGRIYTIKITCNDASGNSSFQNITVTVPINAPSVRLDDQPALSTGENPTLNINVSPNPSSNNFNLVINRGNDEKAEIKIFDMTGRLVSQMIVPNNENFLFGEELIPGNYLLEVQAGGSKQMTKIIKL